MPEYITPERYFTHDNFLAVADVDEKRASARVDWTPMELLEKKNATPRDAYHLNESCREGAFPDLAPVAKCMKKLVRLVNAQVPTE